MGKFTKDGCPTYPSPPDYPANAFAGTAQYYAQYRVPYPKELIDDLRMRSEITGEGWLLDLACGPGRVALPLSPLFRKVWAVDQEPEMIEIGREQATKRCVKNVRWIVGRAEDIEAPPSSFDLITIGEAFHRLDQRLIAKLALEWLQPCRCLATMGCHGITRGNEKWQVIIAEVVRKWTNEGSGASSESTNQPMHPRGAVQDQEVLREAGFVDVQNHEFQHPHVWTLDSIIGNLYSGSGNLRRVLGEKAGEFEADIRGALLAYDSRGSYPDKMRFGYTLGKRPPGLDS